MPIFEAAGLSPGAVQVFLINDRQINAFVAGGQRIFIFTGLLLRAQTLNQVAGVLAHETGHIAGGHLVRSEEAIRQATALQIAGLLLGIAAAAAGGGGAGMGLVMGGQSMAQRSFLAFSRTQESSADQAAIGFLGKAGESPEGLVQFLKILGTEESVMVGRQDPYLRSHPVSADRIAALESRVALGRARDPARDKALNDEFLRVQAKLFAFTEPLTQTLRRYPATDLSVPARYARAVAYYRVADLNRALPEIDGLLKDEPKNPYFLELKGQMLLESGRINEAEPPLAEAVRLAPTEPLLQLMLGQILVEKGDIPDLGRAVDVLKQVTAREPENPDAWRLLSQAYGRQDKIGEASAAAAEWYYQSGDNKGAKLQADRAIRLLPEGSPGWMRANDIANDVSNQRDDKKKN
ncbi:MAG: M48 family metallopeptidase [Alphaproteobacteria bacterium]|nr:M48 family metallopeptidase [Alphaproteobacteria bacterium]